MAATIAERLQSLLFTHLVTSSPILSGNMQSMINISLFGLYRNEITIEAPFYDMVKWHKSKQIVHTGESKKGFTDYANWVNNLGAFGKHNKSENWVNRACYEVCQAIANEIGAVVINELPL